MKCCVIRCNSYSDRRNEAMINENITFHIFPTDETLRQQWIANVNRSDWTPTKNTKICSRHFKADDFRVTKQGLRKLKYGTVPTLNLDLWADDDGIYSPVPTVTPPEHTVFSLPEAATEGSKISLLEHTENEVKEYLILSDSPGTHKHENKEVIRLKQKIDQLLQKAKVDNQKIRTLQKTVVRLNKRVRRLRTLNKELKIKYDEKYLRTNDSDCELNLKGSVGIIKVEISS